jgi:hypothetical protein
MITAWIMPRSSGSAVSVVTRGRTCPKTALFNDRQLAQQVPRGRLSVLEPPVGLALTVRKIRIDGRPIRQLTLPAAPALHAIRRMHELESASQMCTARCSEIRDYAA